MTYHFPALQVPEPRLTYIYKESVRLVLLTKIGIAKRLVEVSEETIFPRCVLCISTQNTYFAHAQTE